MKSIPLGKQMWETHEILFSERARWQNASVNEIEKGKIPKKTSDSKGIPEFDDPGRRWDAGTGTQVGTGNRDAGGNREPGTGNRDAGGTQNFFPDLKFELLKNEKCFSKLF